MRCKCMIVNSGGENGVRIFTKSLEVRVSLRAHLRLSVVSADTRTLVGSLSEQRGGTHKKGRT